tara:strand:+ start:1177 stop:1395 length:219 start_codon:yes stop_codon:yes gene_type:complete
MIQNDTYTKLLTNVPQISEPNYTLEIGHSKSGQNHVIIIKSIKVKGDNPSEVVENTRTMLIEFLKIQKEMGL